MKERKEIDETKADIKDIIDDMFVDLFDDGFKVKYNELWGRKTSITISKVKTHDKFRIKDIQSKVLMLLDYLKKQYTYISYQVKGSGRLEFKHFPLFFYQDITEFKIIITI